jgi:hypothetical protein
MLDLYLQEAHASLSMLPTEIRIICDVCNQEAVIFQDEGNFCLDCWQDRTEPRIT